MRKISGVLWVISESLPINKLLKLKHLFSLILCFIGLSLNASAVPSLLDLTFGSDGKVVSSPDGSELTSGEGMALQPDGKIVMVGDGANLGIIVARYNSNGSLDTTFGSNGWTSVTFGADSTSAHSIDVQPDGKIVVGGAINSNVNSMNVSDFAVARFNPNGSLDTTFDGDGKATVSFNPEVIASVSEGLISLKVASDGKIVVAGYLTFFPQIGKFGIARLNADGSLDTSFGTNGRVIDNLDYYKLIEDMTVLPDGSIVVVGGSGTASGGSRIAQKYNVNGGLEWTYTGSDGINIFSGLNGVAVQPDGKLIVVGDIQDRAAAIRLNTDGTVDNSFNSLRLTNSSQLISVAIQPDGKIVTNYFASGFSGFSLVRYNPNGTLDSGFGGGGTLNVRLTDGYDYGKKVLIQPDGKILVGGYTVLSNPERNYFSMARFNSNLVVPNRPQFDYDGDGKSDVSVFRPSNGVWYVNQSTNGFFAAQFGISTDRIVPADYDGDDKTDIAIYRDGVWWILQSADNSVKVTYWGIAEDKPQAGDFDGDGKGDLAVYRPSTGVWYILRSSDDSFVAIQWGLSEDIPQAADYDGDGRTDIAVFRPSNGFWYIQRSLGGNLFIPFGSNGDRPVANDYDGDNRADIAIWRPTTREWFILRSSNNQAMVQVFGNLNDIPVPADYDGDGKTDFAVFRPSDGGWYQMLSTQGSASQIFGFDGDVPTPNAFNQ